MIVHGRSHNPCRVVRKVDAANHPVKLLREKTKRKQSRKKKGAINQQVRSNEMISAEQTYLKRDNLFEIFRIVDEHCNKVASVSNKNSSPVSPPLRSLLLLLFFFFFFFFLFFFFLCFLFYVCGLRCRWPRIGDRATRRRAESCRCG